MLNLSIALFLILLLHLNLKKVLYKSLVKAENNYTQAGKERAELLRVNAALKEENLSLQNTFEKIITLYDVTKEISKTLEADRVFSYFKDEMGKYIKVGECKFVKGEADLSSQVDSVAVPFKAGKDFSGYLIAEDIRQEDKEKFHILAQQFILGVKRAVLYQEIQELAITDSLTGIFNRRYYLERFREEIERSKKFRHRFSCLMLDIDHFKRYNDSYGHLVGDAILKEVSSTIKENTRQIDMFCRYGGEEFSIILSETDTEEAKFAAERIRQAIAGKSIRAYDEELKITISIGISTFPMDGQDVQAVIDNADSALYQAKNTGRNKVCLYRE